MKKLFFVFCIAFCATQVVSAQTRKGALAIGGQLGLIYSNSKNDNGPGNYKSTSFRIAPEISYFLSEKFALGLAGGFSQTNSVSTYDPNYSSLSFYPKPGKTITLKGESNNVFVNPYIKYYIKLGETTYLNIKGSVTGSWGKSKHQTYNSNQKYDATGNAYYDYEVVNGKDYNNSDYSIGISPAFTFFPSPKWAIELGLGGNLVGYRISKNNNGSRQYSNFNNGPNNYYPHYYYSYNQVNDNVTNSQFEFLNLSSSGLYVSIFYFIK